MLDNSNNQILENQYISFSNLLRFRGKVTQKENINIQTKIQEILKLNNIDKPSNETITATYSVELQDGDQLIDIEMLIPVNKEISNFNNYEGFSYLPELVINNAIKLCFYGNQGDLQFSMQRLINHIKDNNVKVNTPLYTVITIDREAMNPNGTFVKGYLFIGVN